MSIPWGNEAEIFIISILGGKKFFLILGEANVYNFRGERKFSARIYIISTGFKWKIRMGRGN